MATTLGSLDNKGCQLEQRLQEVEHFRCDDPSQTADCQQRLAILRAFFDSVKFEAQFNISSNNEQFIAVIRKHLYHFLWMNKDSIQALRKLKESSLNYHKQKELAQQGLELITKHQQLLMVGHAHHRINPEKLRVALNKLTHERESIDDQLSRLGTDYHNEDDAFVIGRHLTFYREVIGLHIRGIRLLINTQSVYENDDRSQLVQFSSFESRLLQLQRKGRQLTDLTHELEQIRGQSSAISGFLTTIESKLNQQLSDMNSLTADINATRSLSDQTLADVNQPHIIKTSLAFRHLLQQLLVMVPVFLNYCYGLLLLFFEAWRHIPFENKASIVIFINMMVAMYFFGKKHIYHFCHQSHLKNHGSQSHILFLRIIGKSWGYVCFIPLLIILMLLTKIAYQSYQVILWLVLIATVYLSIIKFTKISLFETENNRAGHDVRLYRRLKTTLAIGFAFAIGDLISHFLYNQTEIQQFFDFLFMSFLLVISMLLIKSRHLIFQILVEYLNPTKTYTTKALFYAVFIVPACIFVNGVIGVMGYAKLAWSLAHYQSLIVTLVLFFVLIKGVINDLFDYVSMKFIDQLSHGWLWNQAVLKPLHKLTHYCLMALLLYLGFLWVGVANDPKTLSMIHTFWSYRLFNMSGMHITVHSVIYFILVLAGLVWISQWLREFCYRWFYRNVDDVALRNSLAVLTHYAVVILGFIATLNVLGIDISGITYILGGLAVGMGLGLRDFANNIVGGLMLLIERPVKEGDLITVDDIEGRVVHIGLRSMRVCSWDNDEILIPNADTFSKPFTNWTYKDSIVRTVVPIKVHRFDSPSKVKQLILDVLAIIPEVLDEPEPKVYLNEIDESLIAFEIRYYIDIDKNSRTKVRSLVLFAITAQFKAAGIKPPIPSLAILSTENDKSNSTKDH